MISLTYVIYLYIVEESGPVRKESFSLTEEQYKNYMDLGYFNDVAYDWSLEDGIYFIYMSAEDRQLYENNKVSQQRYGNWF